MTVPWWAGLTPVEMSLDCAGERHRLRWADGQLVALDHADPDGERTLAALGGASCECVELLDAWHHYDSDLDVLLLGSRGNADLLLGSGVGHKGGGGFSRAMFVTPPGVARPRPRRRPSGVVRGWTSFTPLSAGVRSSAGAATDGSDHLARLLQLPGLLPDRLAATVIAHWTQRLSDHDPDVVAAMPLLHAALYGRSLAALDQWIGADHPVDVTLADAPAVTRGEAGTPILELPFSWLQDVWARGFAIIAGRFCLTATRADATSWSFTAIGPDLGDPSAITLTGI